MLQRISNYRKVESYTGKDTLKFIQAGYLNGEHTTVRLLGDFA